ncbi:hypothetical protein EBB79_09195 [Parasedimentitalea marina]|uniref:Uncharacterized protein n=1 Tax=Parasedimentitalea marina TaxID=2483033 RepID=A0A3T0N202_9RHOB|nr:hypothetical protein EBB79_09195 [Parasedimentitalea marina]
MGKAPAGNRSGPRVQTDRGALAWFAKTGIGDFGYYDGNDHSQATLLRNPNVEEGKSVREIFKANGGRLTKVTKTMRLVTVKCMTGVQNGCAKRVP